MKTHALGRRLLSLALAVLAVMVGPIAVPRPASAQPSAVTDPVGDVNHHAPAFQDIVSGEIQKNEDRSFTLRMEMAGPVPDKPALPPPGNSEIWWVWGFNLDPMAFPKGYPFPPGQALPAEVMVYVAWDGAKFTGNAIDRRPLLTGQDAIVTPIVFSVKGAAIEATLVSPTDFPASFGWGPRTFDWSSPPGPHKASCHVIDTIAPSFTSYP